MEPGPLAREPTDEDATAPSGLAWRVWAVIHAGTRWLTGQEALAQMRTRARFPWAAQDVARHARKAQVTPLTGRPCTTRHTSWRAVGTERPAQATAFPAGPWLERALPLGGQAGRRSRDASAAGRHGSTTRHLRRPPPRPDGWRPSGAAGRGGFFARIRGVGTAKPLVRAGPTHPQADDGLQPRRACKGGSTQALRVPHRREPLEGPHTRRRANGPGALMEEDAYRRPFRSVQPRRDRERPVRAARHTGEALRLERVQHVADRWWRTASGLGDRCRLVLRCARQQAMAAAHGEGIGTTPPRLKRGARIGCAMANVERWFHRREPNTRSHTCTTTLLKLH
jgi:hypothetical protein